MLAASPPNSIVFVVALVYLSNRDAVELGKYAYLNPHSTLNTVHY